ncbi:MAG: response regulator [Thermoanaerobaculia bacterium]
MPGLILIADDDLSVRNLLALVARRAGFEVDEVGDGHLALEKLREKEYVVLLVDLMMPRLDGYSVVAELRGKQNRPAVIVVTAFPPSAVDTRLDPDVVDAVIHKPFDVDMVSGIITALAASVQQKTLDETIRTKTRKREAAAAGKCPYCAFEFSPPPAGDPAYVRTAILLHLARCPARPALKDDRDLQRLVDDITESLEHHFHPN